MTTGSPATGQELRSLVTRDGTLELSLLEVPISEPQPNEVVIRNFGMAWGIGGWLLTPFLQSIGPEAFHILRQRVASELQTTFASTYTREVSLAEALQPDAFSVYAMHATGEKHLITPHKSLGNIG